MQFSHQDGADLHLVYVHKEQTLSTFYSDNIVIQEQGKEAQETHR